MTLDELKKEAAGKGIQLSEKQLAMLDVYARLLQEWNQKMNLTAITEYGEIVEKHFLDCILPLTELHLKGSCGDVGSGAGFPGLVWKIICPEVKMTLIEPTAKRCRFLEEVIRRLQLKDIEVSNERAEEHVRTHRASYDFITARAVSRLPVLLELTVPLLKKGGTFIAMKGSHGEEEKEESAHALSVLHASVIHEQQTSLEEGDRRINLFIRKDQDTPALYPRNYGQIKKKPL